MAFDYWWRAERRVRRHLGLRRFHAYCVGAAKTGTTSIARMLATRYLAAHEPDTVATNRLAIGYVRGDLGEDQAKAALLERDRRLRLEMDSSHPLGYLAPLLQDLFPDARFVVTVREPLSWLRSRVNFHDATDPPKWREYRQYFWYDQDRGHAPEEASLRAHGLVSIDTYLAQYADHYRLLLTHLDWDRALLVRTSELSASPSDLATFLGVSRSSISITHAKRGRSPVDLLASVDGAFVRAAIARHCRPILERWFPETLADYG
jgi:hypothetical protein